MACLSAAWRSSAWCRLQHVASQCSRVWNRYMASRGRRTSSARHLLYPQNRSLISLPPKTDYGTSRNRMASPPPRT